jgi:hypothetical protein
MLSHVLATVAVYVTVHAAMLAALVLAYRRPWRHADHYSSSR